MRRVCLRGGGKGEDSGKVRVRTEVQGQEGVPAPAGVNGWDPGAPELQARLEGSTAGARRVGGLGRRAARRTGPALLVDHPKAGAQATSGLHKGCQACSRKGCRNTAV